ncbi:hypothetical protein [Amycolatopsis nigrescens]|uniref:hypothetical protein n=1 Tax=Amycolatopsis nigrescens TaxID=381445 RepID=UPI0012FA88D0|nr:hypothetical protein [Amycolatopsis nigrescens]
MRQVIAQSAQASVTVLGLSKYPDGLAIELEAAATTGGAEPGEVLRTAMAAPGVGTGVPDAVLRFGIHLEDGRTATTLDHTITPLSPPTEPYFASLGGPGFHISGNELTSQQTLWLWPRSVADKFKLVTEWPIFGIPGAMVVISGVSLDIELERG